MHIITNNMEMFQEYVGEEMVLAISTSLTELPLSWIYDRGVILKVGFNGDINIKTQYRNFVTNFRSSKASQQ